MISAMFINVLFLFAFFVIEKHGEYFGLMLQTQKSARGLNNLLGRLNYNG